MRRTTFADLVGVSKQMIGKYEKEGLVVVRGEEVDVATSLSRLAGKLDEGKRRQGLAWLSGASLSTEPPPTARQERDAIDRDLKRLKYGQESGELVSAREVADAAVGAVGEMREAFANSSRDLANEICAAFSVPSDRSQAMKRHLSAGFERALGRFSAALTSRVDEPDKIAATG